MPSTLPNPTNCCTTCNTTIDLGALIAQTVQGACCTLVVPSTTALRAVTTLQRSTSTLYIKLGDATPGDGMGHVYYFDSASSAVDDGLSVVQPDDVSGAGRFLQFL